MRTDQLEACYRHLGVPDDASLKDIEDAYFQLRGQMICAGNREQLPALKAARDKVKRHLLTVRAEQSLSSTSAAVSEPTAAPVAERLTEALAHRGMVGRASLRGQILHLGIAIEQGMSQQKIAAEVYALLSERSPADYGLGQVEIVRLYGLGKEHKTHWKQSFPMPNLQATADDKDLYSFNNRFSNTVIFPGLMLVAALLNSIPAIPWLLGGVNIWIHECGHATVAWLCGYKAIPLPFGWSNTSLNKSWFVYFGVLTLLGLLFWTGKKEQRRWPMVLAIALIFIQFYLTWLISEDTYDLLLSFGGVGGEFYLSTLLIVSFYFPLPEKWRWDFYRYPAVLMAGFTFVGSSMQWRQIKSGLQDIPWGTLLFGSGDAGGDMNRLVGHGWGDQRIIESYNSLGGLCLIVMVSVYAYFFLKQRNHLFLYSLWRRAHDSSRQRV